MISDQITLPAAFLAGVLSFLSPCVLPLVPPYLAYIGGTGVDDLASVGLKQARRDTLRAALLFVAGFSVVFIILGATATVLGQAVRSYMPWLTLLAGVAIIMAGLHFLGLFRLTWLYREARFAPSKPPGLWGAFVMGLAFAFGWTPCIGPVLASILAVAGASATPWSGIILLGVYSLGLGLPFMIAAMAMDLFLGFLTRMRRYYAMMEKLAGILLVATGCAFLGGWFQTLSFWLIEHLPFLAALG